MRMEVKMEMPNIINLTPHDITVKLNGSTITFPRSGMVARVTSEQKIVGTIEANNKKIRLVEVVYGDITGYDFEANDDGETYYIVSFIVAQAIINKQSLHQRLRGRILVPNTTPTPLGAVRDENGRIVAVRSFQVF